MGLTAICLTVSLGVPAVAQDQQRAILDLVVNQVPKGEALVIIQPGDILVRRADLEQAGLHGFSGRQKVVDGESYVSLQSLVPAVSYKFDENALTLSLTAQPGLLGTSVVNLGNQQPEGVVYNKNTSAFFNYALNGQNFGSYSFFGESGLSLKGNLLYGSFSRKSDGAVVRGLTNFTLDNRNNLTRWVVGDSFASTGNLGGSLFLAGVSVSREFGLNPYLVRQPTFDFSGAVLTPSTVEVFVNGQRIRREELPPGQFELNNLLLPAGSGATRVVIRDAFGREQAIASPFYFSAGLLKPGFSDYSFNLGFRRKNLDADSWNYGAPVFLGRYSQGLTNSLTVGGRWEAAPDLVSGGPTVTAALPFGAMELSAAASNEAGLAGTAASLAYSYSGGRVGLGGSLRLLSDHYANLSLKALEDRPLVEANAFISTAISRNLSTGVQYSSANFRDAGQTRRVSLFSTLRLSDRANLFLSASHASRTDQPTSNEAFLGLTYSLGGNTTANLSQGIQNGQPTTTLAVQQSPPVGTGLGYRFQGNANEQQVQGNNGRLEYQAPFGEYELGYDRSNKGQGTTSFRAAGGVVAIGGNVFFTRPVGQSFALIQVPGIKGVRGYASNQEIGRTNAKGNLLVPNLLPYYGNRLGIADEDIPLNYSIEAKEELVAPPLRGGVVVRFPIQRIQALTGTVVVEAEGKTIIPVYGQLKVSVDGKSVESPIGEQGEFYLENLAPGHYPAKVEYTQRNCQFSLKVPASDQPLVNLGQLQCIAS